MWHRLGPGRCPVLPPRPQPACLSSALGALPSDGLPLFPRGEEGPWTWILGAWPPPQLCPKLASSPTSQQPSLSFSFVTSVSEAEPQSPDLLRVVLVDPAGLCPHGGGESCRPGRKGPCLRDAGPLTCTSSTRPRLSLSPRSPTCVQGKPTPPCLP